MENTLYRMEMFFPSACIYGQIKIDDKVEDLVSRVEGHSLYLGTRMNLGAPDLAHLIGPTTPA